MMAPIRNFTMRCRHTASGSMIPNTDLKLTVLSVCLLILLSSREARAQGYYDGSYQEFYDALSPYGQWIDDPQYRSETYRVKCLPPDFAVFPGSKSPGLL